jgi:serine/threonine protein kinase
VDVTSEPVLAERYQLEEVIGRGGMAEVHRATDRVLHRVVAVKVLRDTADDESDRLRFTAEARTLARLSHPGLVMVLDAGITAERPYLVMELVEGRTLSQLCSGGPLTPARVAAVGAQLADALAYAHAEGVVHRDVKPGNVLVGPEDRVKLADFGIARLIGDTVRHTKTGLAIGTAAYLAPEQVRGEEVTTAVDVYSLGLVLLETLTGERAFPGSPTESALARLQRDPEVPRGLPAGWQNLLAAMVQQDPARRPSAAEAASALRSLCGDPGATGELDPHVDGTRLLTTPVRTARPTRRAAARPDLPAQLRERAAQVPQHQWGIAGAVAAVLLLMVVVALATGGSDPEGREVPADTPSHLVQPLQGLHDAVDGGQQ